MNSNIFNIASEADFHTQVLQSPVPVLVDFWAPWCGPCKMIAPLLDQIANETAGRFRIAKVNVDEQPELQAGYSIQYIPALLFFAQGQLQHQESGGIGKVAIINRLTDLENLAPAR
jgi:thioredoxin 1